MNPARLWFGAPLAPARGAARGPSYLVRRLLGSIVFACAHLLGATTAQAHPHVWVTMKTDLIYAPDGSLTGVRHDWTFDDMFSAFATTGISAKTKGQFTREELQPLAQVNVESLKEYAYFTNAWIDGKRQKDAFSDPVDYWLTYDPNATTLTLHFTLPFKKAVTAKRLLIEIYDPQFFIDFGFAESNPVRLVGAPAQCTFTTQKPFDESFQTFMSSESNIGNGMSFANRISVKCP
jgi:ABC-type uncharacterized transport system substrate-binding protein